MYHEKRMIDYCIRYVIMSSFKSQTPHPPKGVIIVIILVQTPHPPLTWWRNTWTLPYLKDIYLYLINISADKFRYNWLVIMILKCVNVEVRPSRGILSKNWATFPESIPKTGQHVFYRDRDSGIIAQFQDYFSETLPSLRIKFGTHCPV